MAMCEWSCWELGLRGFSLQKLSLDALIFYTDSYYCLPAFICALAPSTLFDASKSMSSFISSSELAPEGLFDWLVGFSAVDLSSLNSASVFGWDVV